MSPERSPFRLHRTRRSRYWSSSGTFPWFWTDYPLIVAGIEAALRSGISYWDGAIIAAAERLGASTLYTEDLNHGQRYASVRAVNPFLPGPHDSVHENESPQYG